MRLVGTYLAISLVLGGSLPALAGPVSAQLETRTLARDLPAGGGAAVALEDDTWLVSTADGLYQVAGQRVQRLAEGRFESLDARSNVRLGTKQVELLSAIDVNAGRVVVFALTDAGLSELLRVGGDEALPEAQCLFRDPLDGDLSLFTVDARGMVSQTYVVDAAAAAPVALPVRRFIGVPEAVSCAVHDASAALYLAEESLGVWRYRADPERDPTRQPVLLHAPHGILEGEIADIALDPSGGLWVLGEDSRQLYHLQAGASEALTWPLPGSMSPESMALRASEKGVELAVFDERNATYRLAIIELDTAITQVHAGASHPPALSPTTETTPVARYGDAADDPAIYVQRDDPAASLILGTDKRAGLMVYGLDGSLRQQLPVGRLNNVDLLYDVELGERRFAALAAASNRTHNTISLFSVDNDAVTALAELPTDLSEVYGLCMYQSRSGNYVFINDTDGRYRQYRLRWRDGRPDADLVRSFELPSQPEGCTAEHGGGRIFLGEEGAGIHVAGAEPDGAAPELVIGLSEYLVADVEGMDLYRNGHDSILVVSSQGSDSYALIGLDEGYPFLGHFRVRANLAAGIDGASETDGLAVTSEPLPGYPRGLLVVQDGRNRMPDAPQNFKLVDWRAVANVLETPAP